MKIAIMQPYFFPYLGQFQLIHAADRFVICDDVQYIRHGWINRNRILKPGEGQWYITVPLVRHGSGELIRNILAVEGFEWKKRILQQLDHYRKRAPHFKAVYQLLTDCFATTERGISRMNALFLKAVCDYIGMGFKIEISSEMNLDYSGIVSTDDWAIRICQQLGATEYLNPPGGTALYDQDKFRQNNLGLSFVQPSLPQYSQGREPFEPGLSIIDVLMFNRPHEVHEMLEKFTIF